MAEFCQKSEAVPEESARCDAAAAGIHTFIEGRSAGVAASEYLYKKRNNRTGG
jgi:hypothetical protein